MLPLLVTNKLTFPDKDNNYDFQNNKFRTRFANKSAAYPRISACHISIA